MANIRYFSDTKDSPVLLLAVFPMKNAEFASTFGAIRARKFDSFAKLVGRAKDGRILPVTRVIEFKANPSLHICNAKCMNGNCNGRCECRCGGANHGRGAFV